MNESHKEFLRQMQGLLLATERRLIAKIDGIENAIDTTCPHMGGTASSSTTSACIDFYNGASSPDTNCCVAEVPTPACSSPDQDASFPSMGVTTVELLREGVPDPVPMSVALQGSSSSMSIVKETLGVDPSTCTGFTTAAPATCSTDCLPQQPMAAPVLVASSPPTPTEYVLDSNNIHVAAVPPVVPYVFPTVPTPAVFAPTVQLQQLYNDNELFMMSSSQHITSKDPVHRPMPWPSFMAVHANGDETRPLHRPSVACDIGPVQQEPCSSSENRAPLAIWSMFNGNLSISYGYIIGIVLCSPSGIYCLDDVLSLLEYWGCASNCVHPAHTYHTTFVWLPCTIPWFQLLIIVRGLELKFLSNGSMPVTLLTVHLDSGNLTTLSCDNLGVDPIVCIGSWLCDVCSLVVCRKSSVQSSTEYYITSESVVGPLNSMKRSVSSYDQFSCAIQGASYWPGYFVTGSQMNLVFAAASRGSGWLVSCVCDGPAISTSIVVLGDELVLQPWDSEHQTVVSNFTKVLYSQTILDICLKKLMLQSLKVSGSTGSVFLLSSKCYHKPTYRTVHVLLRKMFDGWDYTIFNVGTSFSCLDEGVIYTSSICVVEQTLLIFHKPQPPSQVIFTELSIREPPGSYCCFVSLSLDFSPSHDVLLSFCGKPHRIGFLMQGGTCADLSSLVSCRLWLQNHQVTMQIQTMWSPRVRAFVLPVGKCCQNMQFVHSAFGRGALFILIQPDGLKYIDFWWFTTAILTVIVSIFSTGFSMQMDANYSGQPSLLLTHEYHLSIMPSTMSSLTWGNLACTFSSKTIKCALQVTSSELLVLIVAPGGGQGTLQGGRHMPCLNRHKLIQLTWDPGGSQILGSSMTTAWGQAVFQEGRGVRDPSCTWIWAWTWAGTGTFNMGFACLFARNNSRTTYT